MKGTRETAYRANNGQSNVSETTGAQAARCVVLVVFIRTELGGKTFASVDIDTEWKNNNI